MGFFVSFSVGPVGYSKSLSGGSPAPTRTRPIDRSDEGDRLLGILAGLFLAAVVLAVMIGGIVDGYHGALTGVAYVVAGCVALPLLGLALAALAAVLALVVGILMLPYVLGQALAHARHLP
jgi:hypothetical protein